MGQPVEDIARAIVDTARAHRDRYLLPTSRRQYGEFWAAAEWLVDRGYAKWDRNSTYWPCIRITQKSDELAAPWYSP